MKGFKIRNSISLSRKKACLRTGYSSAGVRSRVRTEQYSSNFYEGTFYECSGESAPNILLNVSSYFKDSYIGL